VEYAVLNCIKFATGSSRLSTPSGTIFVTPRKCAPALGTQLDLTAPIVGNVENQVIQGVTSGVAATALGAALTISGNEN